MQLRRAALALGALTLTVAPLSACGGWASEREYTPAWGANERDGDIDVLGAAIVSGTAGEGVFVATLVNPSPDEPVALTKLSAPDEGLTFEEPSGEVPPQGNLNLADEGGVPVTGDFEAGQYTDVTLTMGNGETVTVNVPVVPPVDEFEGLGG